MPKEPLSKLEGKEISREGLLLMVESDPSLLPTVIGGLDSPKPTIRYGCGKVLMELGESHPEWLYPHMRRFVGLMESRYRPLLWNALCIIASLARVDREKIFDASFSEYFAHMNDGYLITAANVVGSAGKIALAKPYLADRIAGELLKVDALPATPHLTAECKRVLAGHAIRSFDSFFDLIAGKEEVLAFVRRHEDSPRKALRDQSRAFLQKWGRGGSK